MIFFNAKVAKRRKTQKTVLEISHFETVATKWMADQLFGLKGPRITAQGDALGLRYVNQTAALKGQGARAPGRRVRLALVSITPGLHQ